MSDVTTWALSTLVEILLEGSDFLSSWHLAHRIGYQLNDCVLGAKSCLGGTPKFVVAPTYVGRMVIKSLFFTLYYIWGYSCFYLFKFTSLFLLPYLIHYQSRVIFQSNFHFTHFLIPKSSIWLCFISSTSLVIIYMFFPIFLNTDREYIHSVLRSVSENSIICVISDYFLAWLGGGCSGYCTYCFFACLIMLYWMPNVHLV